jgi:ABC-type sugar transport system ATPase subunit
MSVDVRGLVVDYGSTRALDEVSFSVADGEFVVILGPSGCGKTTALKCIAGLIEPTKGEIYIDGRLVNGIYPSERNIAMVFQNYALYPHMTVYDNIALNMKMRNIPRQEIERRVREVASLLKINELLQKKPRQLSGGQAQRVGLARALVRNPSVFLMDEPLSNLDAKLRLEMRDEIKRFHALTKKCIIYVTHDQIEAMTLGDRIIVMNKGRIIQIDRPKDLFDNPRHMFVASFLGNPPMNLVPARSEGRAIIIEGDKRPLISVPDGTHLPEKIFLGFRPTDLRLSSDGPLKGKLEYVELLGAELNVHFLVGETRCTARLIREASNEHLLNLPTDNTVSFSVPDHALFFFNGNGGERLSIPFQILRAE